MNILDNNQNDQFQVNTDPAKNYIEELVGEGKKFKSIEDLARGKFESDQYIDHMKGRMDELRQDYTKLYETHNAGPSLKETLDQYIAELKTSQGATPPLGQNEDKSVPLDEAKLAEVIKQHIAANKQLDVEEANARNVEARLQEAYGPNYKQLVSQQISQLGLSVDFFNNLARTSPNALYNTLGLNQARGETFQAPVQSTQRSDPFSKNKRTETFYEKLRKEKPLEYRSPKIQDQMFRDAQEQGESFFDMKDIPFGR